MTSLAGPHLTIIEDVLFALSGAEENAIDGASGVLGRRTEVHRAAMTGPVPHLLVDFEPWLHALVRASAPVAPPGWLPMGDVLREKVTLEVGARGIRSLFRSTPSDKDVSRVKKVGGFTARILRGIFAADGALTPEENRTIAIFVHGLGLPEADESPLLSEPPFPAETLDVVGEVEPKVLRAILGGAWLASAWDTIDPREETYVRTLATRLSVTVPEIEAARTKAIERVDARKKTGGAAVEGLRYVLADALASGAIKLLEALGVLMLPLKYREEVLGPAIHGTPVTLAKRHVSLGKSDRATALAIVWAGALFADPTASRRLELAARHDAFAADLQDDGRKVRMQVEEIVEAAMMAALTAG